MGVELFKLEYRYYLKLKPIKFGLFENTMILNIGNKMKLAILDTKC